MKGFVKDGISIISDLKSASNNKRKIGKCLESKGFKGIGNGVWIGVNTKDVVSGLMLEGTPAYLFITYFVMPIFEPREFVNLNLGKRIVDVNSINNPKLACEAAVSIFNNELKDVTTADNLFNFVNNKDIAGYYPAWVLYLCLLRQREFKSAIRLIEEMGTENFGDKALEKFNYIHKFVIDNNHQAVLSTLQDWENISRNKFGYPLDDSQTGK